MDIATILLGAAMVLLAWLLWHLTHNRGHLETLGIPVDKPIGLLGSGPLDFHNHLVHEIPLKKFRQFKTKTYGKYDGVVPVIMTVDPEIIKSVMVKNFDRFSDVFSKVINDHLRKFQ